MRPGAGLLPDRVPVMCQLALGHYFLHAGLDPIDVWHDSEAFAEALVRLQQRYGFDGILVNLPGRDPSWRDAIARIDEGPGGARRVHWRNGCVTDVPPDDNPHVFLPGAARESRTPWSQVDPARLVYVEPHDLFGLTLVAGGAVSPFRDRTIREVRRRAPDVSVHGEVFSPFSQLLELVDYAEALTALIDEPDRVIQCLSRLAGGAVAWACSQAEAGADAILISSAFAGAGFISPRQYRTFVLPAERAVVEGIKARWPDLPVYTHTCGAIGDRLELMMETGIDGIDTLDPPPLGTVELGDAKVRVGTRLFIKGNLDPVGTLLKGTPRACREAALERVSTGKPGGGYILSTACSVAPRTPPEHILELLPAALAAGAY